MTSKDIKLLSAALPAGKAKKPGRRHDKAESAKPLAESFAFVDWSLEYKIIALYRSMIVRGDNAALSLMLIREALLLHGEEALEKAVQAYAAECKGTEARFRKRPFSFFKPDIYSQFLPGQAAPTLPSQPLSSIDELKAAIKTKAAEAAAAAKGDSNG